MPCNSVSTASFIAFVYKKDAYLSIHPRTAQTQIWAVFLCERWISRTSKPTAATDWYRRSICWWLGTRLRLGRDSNYLLSAAPSAMEKPSRQHRRRRCACANQSSFSVPCAVAKSGDEAASPWCTPPPVLPPCKGTPRRVLTRTVLTFGSAPHVASAPALASTATMAKPNRQGELTERRQRRQAKHQPTPKPEYVAPESSEFRQFWKPARRWTWMQAGSEQTVGDDCWIILFEKGTMKWN